jgi:hypothetical protein
MSRPVDKDFDYGRGKGNEWMGEVRSIEDPTDSGKVQVRIFGHEDDLQKNPDEKLRWAEVAYPTTAGQVPGSSTMHGLMQGSKVVGTFFAGDEQKPIILYVLNKPSPKKAS